MQNLFLVPKTENGVIQRLRERFHCPIREGKARGGAARGLSNFSFPLWISAWIVSCAVAAGQTFGQAPLEIDAPHEIILAASPESAPRVTELRDWTLVDGGRLKGRLIQWVGLDEWIQVADQFDRVQTFPLRQFAPPDRERIEQTLGDWLQTLRELRQTTPIRSAAQGAWMQGDNELSGAMLVRIEGDASQWLAGREYLSIPLSAFTTQQGADMEARIDQRDQLPTWRTTAPDVRFSAQLIGKLDDTFIFKGLWKPLQPDPLPVRFRFRADHLVPEDRQRADAIVAAQSANDGAATSPEPDLWCWPGETGLLGPANPQRIEGDELIWATPDHRPERALFKKYRRISRSPLERFAPDAELDVRLLMLENELRAENTSVSSQQITEARAAKRMELMDEQPLRYLAVTTRWNLRDTDPNQIFSGTLVGESGSYYVVLCGDDATPVAILKEELVESSAAAAERTVQRLDAYFAAHPEAQRPRLTTDYRLVRRSGVSPTPMEPVAFDGGSFFDVRNLPQDGVAATTRLSVKPVHFVDLEELRLVLSGVTVDEPDVDGRPRTPDATASDQPSDESKPAADRRAQMARSIKIQQYLNENQSWGLTQPTDKDRVIQLGVSAAVVGQHLDSFIMRREGVDFLVDADLLSAAARTEAERKRSFFEELISDSDFTLDTPVSRLWGVAPAMLFGPGENPEFLANGDFSFTAADGTRTTISADRMTPAAEAEIRTQIAADAGIRASAAKTGDAESLEAIQTFKTDYRNRLKEELRQSEPSRLPTWSLADSQTWMVGSFVCFDGEDAIMRDRDGRRFRVYKFALTDETLSKMTELVEERQAEENSEIGDELELTAVTDRLLRTKPRVAPMHATPVTADRNYLYLREGKNGVRRVPIANFHHLDGSELRGKLYREEHQISRDPDIDDRLRQPVDAGEIVRTLPALADDLHERLDRLAQPSKRNWDEHPIQLAPSESLSALAPDGRLAVITGQQVRVIDRHGKVISHVAARVDPAAPVFLADDHQRLVAFADGELTIWDLAKGGQSQSFSAIAPPATAIQSADSKRIVFATADGILYIVRPEEPTVRKMELALEGDETLQPRLWCSEDGMRIAVASTGSLYLLAVDAESGEPSVEGKLPLTAPVQLMAVSDQGYFVGNPDQAAGTGFNIVDGRVASVRRDYSVLPRWLGIATHEGRTRLTVMGIPDRTLPGVDKYTFAATYNLMFDSVGRAEVIEHDFSEPTLVASSGNAVAFKRGGQSIIATRPEQVFHHQILRSVARDLVEEQRFDQLDAAWAHLRTERFWPAGNYPDHMSELLLEYLEDEILHFQWQHGGDLKQRAGLLLGRWHELVPKSIVIPVLRGDYHRDLAWEARGDGFADTVTEEGFQVFNKQMRRTAELIKPLLELESPPTRVFSLAYSVSTSLSLSRKTVGTIAEKQSQTPARWSPTAHMGAVLYLLPRWHGNEGDSERYIRQVGDRLGGDAGDAMYTQLVLYIVRFYSSSQPATDFLDLDLDRVLAGLRAYYASADRDTDVMKDAVKLFEREQREDLRQQALQLAAEQRLFLAD